MLESSTTAAIESPKSQLRAGCSVRAVTVRPGRDNEPVVSEPTPPEQCRSTCAEGFPRGEFTDGSSLFIVRSFPSRLVCEDRYYGIC